MSIRVNFEIGHEASIRSKRTIEGFTHDWEIFVRGCDNTDIQYYVEKVVFHLHDTFSNPKRVIKEPPYRVRESGYAGFTLPIDIYFRNNEEPKKIRFSYDLNLQTTGPAIFKVQKEKYVFNNPNEEFRHKLLKGGGISLGSISNTNDNSRDSLSDKSKTKSSSSDLFKKYKSKEHKPENNFTDLFGTPITKTSKNTTETKLLSKPSPTNNSTKTDKTVNPKKMKSKHTPKEKDKEREKEKKDKNPEKKHKEEKKNKDRNKDKERKEKVVKQDRSVSPSNKSPKRVTSPPPPKRAPSPKRPPSPLLPPTKKSEEKKPEAETSKEKVKPESKKSKYEQKEKERDKEKKDYKSQKEKDTTSRNSETPKEHKTITKDQKLSKESLYKSKEKSIKPDETVQKESEKIEKSKVESEKSKHKHKKKDNKDRKEKKEEKIKDKRVYKEDSKDFPKEAEKNSTNSKPSDSNIEKIIPKEKAKGFSTLQTDLIDESSSSSINTHDESSIEIPTKSSKTEYKKKDKPKLEPSIEKKRKRKHDAVDKDEIIPKIEAPSPSLKVSREESDVKPNPVEDKKETIEEEIPQDYMTILKELQKKIMALQDNTELQKVVELIAQTGHYEITAQTFDFDLCALDRDTVRRLQEFFTIS